MIVGIVGSRAYPAPQYVRAFVNALDAASTVVSGGAPGVDTVAADAAHERGLAVTIFLADWDKHDRKAGPLRNKQIVDASDQIIAFWDGKSRGTLNSILLATNAGKPVKIFDSQGTEIAVPVALDAAAALKVKA